mmetsp:Transcript_6485/g.14396  ORF Transcript_6485/g.14396 Transcript_6485/m.14396 type:complete len:102 (+) Transcript_6485:1101-1406(+)
MYPMYILSDTTSVQPATNATVQAAGPHYLGAAEGPRGTGHLQPNTPPSKPWSSCGGPMPLPLQLAAGSPSMYLSAPEGHARAPQPLQPPCTLNSLLNPGAA